ncbi:MAG: glycosyltransferase [Chitinophagaceae bacterium]|nr:MAG: glycosyltransferase [Chitinophagaceae bacterium]
MKKKKIIVSVISELTTDQRVIRICTTLEQMGFEVFVIARALKGAMPLGEYKFKASRISCFFKKGILAYTEFNIKLFIKLLFSKTDFLLANDLDTLTPNFIISKIKNKTLFYDTHEYFTGVPELTQSPFKQKVWQKLEDLMLPRIKYLYTVNDSVKNKYKSIYPTTHFKIIRNIPPKIMIEPYPIPKHWEGKIILMMQGIGINPGRGGMELLLAFNQLPQNYQLVYIGGGLEWKDIKDKRDALGLTQRVDMLEKLPPEQLKKYTPLAHIGFTLDGFENENYLFNLPNKIFDYIHAGVPVIATPIPEVKKIVEQYQIGFCLKNTNPKEMATAIEQFIINSSYYNTCKQNTIKAAEVLCWQNEQEKLIEIYKPFL